jgi:methionyl-tRNA formyltransferase
MKKSLVFFGTEQFSVASLEALYRAGYKVACVVTKPDSKRGRGQEISEPPVKALAASRGSRVLQPHKLVEVRDELAGMGAELGVLVAYGKIVPRSIIDLFPLGIINVHPSLLPKYRGPSPIESAILNGDRQTGVSLMRLTAKMDAGPVYAQKTLSLDHPNRMELYEQLADIGARLLVDNLHLIIEEKLQPRPQNDSQATYTKLISKQDGLLDLSKSAGELERQIRAYAGWPRSRTAVFGSEIIITKARIAAGPEDGGLIIKCGEGYLEILELIAPSGRLMSGDSYRRGYQR